MTLLQGKSALITGGAAGIGFAIAKSFLDVGASVLITDVDETGLREARSCLDAGERLQTLRADVSKAGDWQRAAEQVQTSFGKLDILVNNAGIEVLGTVETVSEEQWDRIMSINVKSIYLSMRAMLPMLRQTRGTVVNVASIAGLIGAPGWIAYITSKHAVVGATKSLALDYAKDGIRVNAICPGMVQTPMAERIDRSIGGGNAEAGHQALASAVPMGRYIRPEEVAAIAVHFASDQSRFTTGTCYVIDGGATVG